MVGKRIAALSAAVVLLLPPSAMAAGFEGAARDEDGRFVNETGSLAHGSFLRVRFPFFLRRLGGAFRSDAGVPESLVNDGAFLRENARHSVSTVTWIGHATLLVQMEHLSFLTDPIWSKTASPVSFAGPRRFVPPGLALDDLPPIDFVLISHNHYDHLDLATLEKLAERRPETVFVVPLGNASLLRDSGIESVVELDWGGVQQIGAAEIHCLPAQHWSKRSLSDDRKALWSSWAVLGSERRFYFAGDTGYFPGFARIGAELGPFDLAALPIGAYQPTEMMRSSHLDPEEAVQAGLDVDARHLLGVHFGTFDLSDEPLDEPPRRFLERAAQDDADAWVLRIGETREF